MFYYKAGTISKHLAMDFYAIRGKTEMGIIVYNETLARVENIP